MSYIVLRKAEEQSKKISFGKKMDDFNVDAGPVADLIFDSPWFAPVLLDEGALSTPLGKVDIKGDVPSGPARVWHPSGRSSSLAPGRVGMRRMWRIDPSTPDKSPLLMVALSFGPSTVEFSVSGMKASAEGFSDETGVMDFPSAASWPVSPVTAGRRGETPSETLAQVLTGERRVCVLVPRGDFFGEWRGDVARRT